MPTLEQMRDPIYRAKWDKEFPNFRDTLGEVKSGNGITPPNDSLDTHTPVGMDSMKAQDKLQLGDRVRLKSGGPDMKVVLPEVRFVYVTYDGLDGKHECFPIHCLKKA
jgi:uncharacterized protein YodC (DUF2158 family)